MALSQTEYKRPFYQEAFEKTNTSWQKELSYTESAIHHASRLKENDPRLETTLQRVRKAYYDYYLPHKIKDSHPGSFAFIVHPRDPIENDIARQFPAMTPDLMDEQMITPIFQSLPPFILGEYSGLKDTEGTDLTGYVLSAPITVEGIYSQGKAGLINAKHKTIDTARFAKEKLGVEIVGLGESLGTLSKFGNAIEKDVEDLKATTGHAYTVYLVGEALMQGVKATDADPSQSTLAIVGAGGAIGSSAARLLDTHVGNIILIDKGVQIQRAHDLASQMSNPNVSVTNSLDSLSRADLVVSATNDPEPFIKREYIKPGTIIVDDSQPVNMTSSEARDSQSLLLHPIGRTPEGVKRSFDFSLPEGTDFSCALEVMILAASNAKDSFSHRTIGRLEDVDKVRQIAKLAQKTGFELAPLQSFGREITDDEINAIRHIRNRNS